jgi:hypothetical protein
MKAATPAIRSPLEWVALAGLAVRGVRMGTSAEAPAG